MISIHVIERDEQRLRAKDLDSAIPEFLAWLTCFISCVTGDTLLGLAELLKIEQAKLTACECGERIQQGSEF